MFKTGRAAAERATGYATGCDFAEIFTKDVDRLYLIAFLLTVDHGKTERCILNALDSCLKGTPVFCNWAQAWSKRAVIKQALDMVAPAQAQQKDHAAVASNKEDISTVNVLVRAILALDSLERFSFVISVLERYSDRETSSLLKCGTQDVREARSRALRSIVSSLPHEKVAKAAVIGQEQSSSVLRWPKPLFDRSAFSQGEA